MTLVKLLKDDIDEQLEFIKWLKEKEMYDPMESGNTMNKMFKVWKAATEPIQEQFLFYIY